MAHMHSCYVSNTKDEIKNVYQELNETTFEELIDVDDQEL
ncbi:20569_t:CDS:2 [Entrophospora sp. SA101]|nr:20569_t:CDS:2 [Entrophospora sp. SA101]